MHIKFVFKFAYPKKKKNSQGCLLNLHLSENTEC